MEPLLFTALGLIVGLILRAGREEEARQEGIAIGRRQARAQMRPPFPMPPVRPASTARPTDPGPISTKPRRRT